MSTIHKNYDAVFKEALTLFKDKALDFLGITGIAPITEPLATEGVQVDIKSEFRDLVFATQGEYGLHLEEEVNLSADDLLRFCNYNVGLQRTYKRPFITVVLVKNPTALQEINTPYLMFRPIVVQCANINADKILDNLRADIDAGKPINELQLIYLPLFASTKYNPVELFKESTQLIHKMQTNDNERRKLYALVTVLSKKIVPKDMMKKYLREVDMRDNVIIQAAEEIGAERERKRERERMAIILLKDGIDVLDVIKYTLLSVDEVRELRDAVRREEAAQPA